MTEPNVPDEKFESVLLGYLEQRESENAVDVEAFCDLHPEIADRLREYIRSEQDLFQMAGPTIAEHSAWRASAETSRIAQQHTDTRAEHSRAVVPTQVPKEFGRYELVRKLGEGAMGSVYLAKDNELQRQVALKFPRHSLDSDTDLAARFHREARSAAALHHRNLCPVLDVGQHDGTRYLSMAFIDGSRLDESIRKGALLDPDSAAEIIAKIARAVEVAHRHGIVHRDLKPSNVMIDAEGEPVVMDFGLALHTDEVGPSRLTQDGAIVGTPAYMAPEQIDRELAAVGPASDIYSLGVLFYELLTGRLPFEGGMSQVVHQAILKRPAVPSSIRPEVTKPLEDICLKMLSKSPSARYGSMAEVAEAIERATQVAASDPPLRRGPHWISSFTAGIGLVSLLAFTLWLAAPTIFKVKTADGMIIVEVPEGGEEIEVEVLQGGKQVKVIDADDGWVMRIEAGEYKLAVNDSSDRFVVDRRSVTVSRDDTVRVKVSLAPVPPAPITDVPNDVSDNAPNDASDKRVAWITAVRELICQQKYHQAEKLYTESAARFGSDWYTHSQVVMGLMLASRDDVNLLKNVDRHLSSFEQALRASKDLTPPDRAKIAYTLALATHRKLDEKLIERTAQKIHTDRWNHSHGYHALTVIRYRQGKFPLALDHEAEAKRLADPGAQRWLHSYWWAMLLGRHEQLELRPAREAFSSAESQSMHYSALLKPTATLPAEELDAVLEMRWMMPILKQQLAPLESLKRWMPGQSPTMVNLDNEIQTLTKQLLKSPGDASLYYYRAIAFTRSHRSTEAFNDFRSAAKLDPENQIYLAFNRYASFLAGDRPQLREHLEAVVKNDSNALIELDLADPNSVFVFRLLLAAEFETHVYSENIAQLQKLAQQHPDDWYTQHVLGLWLMRTGKLSQAKEILGASLKLVDDVSLERYCTLLWLYWFDEVAGGIPDAERKTRETQLAEIQKKTQLERTRPVDHWLAVHESMLSSIGPHESLQRSVRAVVNKPVTHGEVRIIFETSVNKATEHVDLVDRQAMDNAGRQIAFTPRNHDKLFLVSTEDGEMIDFPSGGTIRCMHFSEDGKSLIIGRPNKAIDVIDLETRRVTKSFPLTGQPNSIDYDSKGNRLAIAFQNRRCAILDLTSNEMLVEPALLSGASGTQMGIFFSPDKSHVAIKLKNEMTTVMTDRLDPIADIPRVQHFCWIDDQTLGIFDNGTNELQLVKLSDVDQRQIVAKPDHAITALVYLDSKQRMISADANGEIIAWSIEGEREPLARLPQAYIHGLVGSGDGRHLLATGGRKRPRDGGPCCVLFRLPESQN